MPEARRVEHGADQQERVHFGFLEGVRGLACMWVVLDHLHVDLLADELPATFARWAFDSGIVGVIVFFVLSGFVIAHSWRDVLPGSAELTPARAGSFLVRRWIRLTPPYYAALGLAVAVTLGGALLLEDGDAAPSAWSWVAHLLYLPEIVGVDPVNAVFWTLAIEMQFYVCFVVVVWMLQLAARRSAEVLQGAIVVLAAAALVWPLRGLDLVNQAHVAAYGFAFVSGMLAYWWWRGVVEPGLFWTYQAILLVAWVRSGEPIIGAAAICGPVLAIATTGDRMRRWFGGPVLQYLGAISYSLYLVHAPVIGVVSRLGDRLLGESASTDALLLGPAVIASFAAAIVMYRLVERPALEWSRARRTTRERVVVLP